MNIKIYVKNINIIKNCKKILKIVYFITIFKKVCSTVAKNFLKIYKYFIILRFISLEILYYEFNVKNLNMNFC